MAGKNGSTPQAAGADRPEQPARDYQSKRKLYVVRNRNDQEGDAPVAQAGASKRRGMLDRSQQAQLGNLLRAIFSDVAEEPVPERFVKLLEALDAREKNQ